MGFFERVLPARGPFCIFTGATGPDGKLVQPRHWNGLQTHADVEREVQRLTLQPLNIFFAVGSYSGANRKEPLAKRALWLDLDGKDFASMSDAVAGLGTFVKATGLPPPSIWVNSGRGVHVYWCFDRDLEINQWQVLASALKAKCQELDFAADGSATDDPARVLRAPGSLNRKEATPLPCTILSDNNASYNPDQLADCLRATITLPASVMRLTQHVSNDDLVSKSLLSKPTAGEIRSMLTHVRLPEISSREQWIVVLCAVQDWSDKSEEGFDIFHDWSAGQPGYESVEDCWKTWDSFKPGGGVGVGTLIKMAKEGGWEGPKSEGLEAASLAEEILGQEITPAVVWSTAPVSLPPPPAGVISPLLIAAYNAVSASGRERFMLDDARTWCANEFVLVLDQEGVYYSLTERLPMTKSSIDDLLTRYMTANASGVPIPVSTFLRRFGTKHIVNSQGFYPGQPRMYSENGKQFVNLYTDPAPLIVPTQNEATLVADFWDYVFPTDEDREFGQYLKCFYAHIVQRPAVKLTSAPLMVSEKTGTGKTTAMYDIPRALVGNDNAKLVSNKVLRSSFSDYVEGAHFLHFDEVHINGKWDSDDTANSMKNLITGTKVEIHPKGRKPYNIPNRLFITGTSNYEDAISLPRDDERRWGVYYLKPTRRYTEDQRRAYFKVLHDWIVSPRGPGVLRWIFSQVDLSGFNPHAPPPLTEAKRIMVDRSQSTPTQAVVDAVTEGEGPFRGDLFRLEEVTLWLKEELDKKFSMIETKNLMHKAGVNARPLRQIREGSNIRYRVWCLRNYEQWEQATNDEIRDALKA
jgi:hypothetical protein